MADPYPTPTRLRRLADVALARTFRYGDGHDYDGDDRRVDAAMAEMERAGWVVLGDPMHAGHKRVWLLTDEGVRVLEEGGRGR